MSHVHDQAFAAYSERVLVLTESGHESERVVEILSRGGVDASSCCDLDELCCELERGVGVALLAEDVLTERTFARLLSSLRAKPPWSSCPLVFFGATDGPRGPAFDLDQAGPALILERPIRARSLLAAVRTCLTTRRRQYHAQRAIDGRDSFLAILGHELRNPLGAISLAVKLLGSKTPEGARSREYRVIERQLQTITALVDDLLDAARVTHGKVSLNRERFALADVVRAAFETLEAQARKHHLSWQLQEHGPAPWVEADRQRLEQVFSNLLVNAIKYTPRGGSVSVEVRADGESAVVFVRDTGVGLSPEMCVRVFEPFTQVDRSLNRAQGGLGLGLALVRSLVQLHAGSVHAESAGPSRGTSFVVRLPRVPAPAPRATDAQETPVRQRIVVVEDNPDLCDVLTELLQSSGVQVTCAREGPTGLETVLSVAPDIALIDIGLPGFDGLELARRARSSGSKSWLVALTAYGDKQDKQLSAAAGFDDHLVKPVTNDDLEQALRRAATRFENAAGPSEKGSSQA